MRIESSFTIKALVLLGALVWASSAAAVTVELAASQDTMLLSDDDTLSNGAGRHFCVGRTGQPATRRSLVEFDISTAGIPAGSTIDAVTLELYENNAAPSGGGTFNVHRVTADWGEGDSDASAGECKGKSAELNDATWRYRFFDPDNVPGSPQWTILGGDFNGTPSASASIDSSNGYKSWSGSGLVADVQLWLDNPGTNYGWLVKRSSEAGSENAIRFGSRQNNNSGQRPRLTVDYTPPAVTGACCFPGQSCQELSAADCGNQGGNFQGSGTDCTPNPCPPDPTGACCFDDGTCSEISETDCDNQGGLHQGDDVPCSSVECEVMLTPFVDALPIPGAAQPVSGTSGGVATYEIAMRELQQQLHSELPPTTVWGYGDAAGASSYPGPTIEATSNLPVTVHWMNEIRDTSQPGTPYRVDHYLEVDGLGPPPECTIHGAEDEPKTVVHLHGGHVPPEVDGYPEDTYLPGNELVYVYPNNQLAGTSWYHDHSLGITRLNVYMGLAGFYLIRDAFEQSLGLPTCPDPGTPDTCDEIGLAIQDRSFNPDGSLKYPDQWQDHFFGDKMLVNGKVWPFLNVRQGKYRFRLLNGCTSRTLTLSLDRLDQPGTQDLSFTQIGIGGGLIELPLVLDEITLASAERADVIVDFAGLPPGTEVVLTNSAPAPWPGSPGVGVVPNVMKFIVQNQAGDTDPIPATLRPFEPIDELEAVRSRDFVLDNAADDCGTIWKINGLTWDEITEYPQLGTTEIWRFINDGNIMHPMHMHLVFFQVLDRAPIGGGAASQPEPNEIGWKDTARAMPGMVTRVIARFEDYAGKYAYHCHLLEHEDHEMMRQFWAVDAVQMTLEPNRLLWTAQPGAVSYDVVRGDLGQLMATGGNFALSSVTEACQANDVAGTMTSLSVNPLPGEGLWYLVRSNDVEGASTYDSGSSTQLGRRDDEIAASGNDCPQ